MTASDRRVLLAGSYGFGNLGDDAILLVLIDELRRRIPGITIQIVAEGVNAARDLYGVDAIYWGDWGEISEAVRRSDAVVLGGGTLLGEYETFHTVDLLRRGASFLATFGSYFVLAALHRKPIALCGAGLGPVISTEAREFLRIGLTSAADCVLRDELSEQLLHSIGAAPRNLSVNADPAFLTTASVDDERRAEELLRSVGGADVAIVVRPGWRAGEDSPWLRPLVEAAAKMGELHRTRFLLVPFQPEFDLAATEMLRSNLGDRLTVLPRAITPGEAVALFGRVQMTLAMRLHASILSIAAGTPIVALSYDPKVAGVLAGAGLQRCVVPRPEAGSIFTAMEGEWERRAATRSELDAVVVRMRRSAQDGIARTAALLLDPPPADPLPSEWIPLVRDIIAARLQELSVAQLAAASGSWLADCVDDRDAGISFLRGELANRDAVIRSRDEGIAFLQRELKEREAQIERMRSSEESG